MKKMLLAQRHQENHTDVGLNGKSKNKYSRVALYLVHQANCFGFILGTGVSGR